MESVLGEFIWLFYYLMVINIVTFFIFGVDKYLAIVKASRISEKVLWILSVVGGSLGGFIGMEVFRHKRRKMSFCLIMLAILLIQVFLIYFLIYKYVYWK